MLSIVGIWLSILINFHDHSSLGVPTGFLRISIAEEHSRELAVHRLQALNTSGLSRLLFFEEPA